MTIWVGQEGSWDHWEPVVAFRTEAQAKRWERRKLSNRMVFKVELK